MTHMPRPRPPHLVRQTTQHGRTVWYFRRGQGRRIRIRAPWGSAEFEAEYQAALTGNPAQTRPTGSTGSLEWLYQRYRETAVWQNELSTATRRQRENIFRHVLASSGAEPFAAIKRSDIVAARDDRLHTPAQARNFLDAMRGLFRWAFDTGHIKIDPTTGVKNPKRKKGQGFPEWIEADVAAYETRWPLGTRQRVWLDVLLYTGGRRGDVHRMGRQHVRNNLLTLRTEKTDTEINIPILPVLGRTLAAGPCGDLAFIVGERGHPLTKETFGNYFSEAARAAGVRKSAHGVRKIAATRCADNGATIHELNAIFGWTGTEMAALYTRASDRKRLAVGAINKLNGTQPEQAIPSPSDEVRATAPKST
jgi:YD repeat-containing protein